MTKTRLQALSVFGALVLTFGFGVWAGVTEPRTDAATNKTPTINLTLTGTPSQPAGTDMSQFFQVWDLLDKNFVQTHASSTIPTEQKKLYGAIAGLVATYGDPYTVFFPPVEAQVFNDDVKGSFGGVGMEIDNNADGQLVVVAPLKGSPAEAAGILTGDIVAAVDGTSTLDMSSNEAVKIIRGPVGTTVKITVLRKGSDKPIDISVVRDTINIPIINSYRRPDNIFVIELYSFSANSADLFRDALRQFVGSGSHHLILDVRGNPGGYLEAAVTIASYFLPVGQPVVTEDYRGKADNVYHRSYGYDVIANDPQFKMAVLVNQGSASASEILAGALQQNGVAKLIGTRTFGKGSVQQLMDLGGGAELKITVARWLTPNGSSISDGGLQADIKADRTQADRTGGRDPQTDAAVNYLDSY